MKTLTTNAVITSITAKVDGSLGLRVGTPELSPTEKAEFMELQNVNLIATFKPLDEPEAPELVIDKELGTKTPGQRLRGVIFVLHQQAGVTSSFEDFYRDYMEKIINRVKENLE
jgi:hypothetical protein